MRLDINWFWFILVLAGNTGKVYPVRIGNLNPLSLWLCSAVGEVLGIDLRYCHPASCLHLPAWCEPADQAGRHYRQTWSAPGRLALMSLLYSSHHLYSVCWTLLYLLYWQTGTRINNVISWCRGKFWIISYLELYNSTKTTELLTPSAHHHHLLLCEVRGLSHRRHKVDVLMQE